jgi:low temperature requirement protein LtrA
MSSSNLLHRVWETARITPNQWWDENGDLNIPKGHRVSSHLDLFYDLVFVVALAQLGKDFRDKAHHGAFEFDHSIRAVLEMAALLTPILLYHIYLHSFTNRFGRGAFSSAVFYLVNFLSTCLRVFILVGE